MKPIVRAIEIIETQKTLCANVIKANEEKLQKLLMQEVVLRRDLDEVTKEIQETQKYIIRIYRDGAAALKGPTP